MSTQQTKPMIRRIPANPEEDRALTWEEIRLDHLVQDAWIDFRRSAYRFPDGRVFEPYYSFTRRDYAVIVASDPERRFLCVRQFRQGIRRVTTEFPAGGIEPKDGEAHDPGSPEAVARALTAAQRELLEETGYESDEWEHLLSLPSYATMSDNYAHVFRARNCRLTGTQHLDEMELLRVQLLTPAEIEGLIQSGNFQQAVHVMAWLLAQRQ